MAKVERPLFSDSAQGLLGSSLAFKVKGGNFQVCRPPSSRVFKSERVLKQQALYAECCKKWGLLSRAEKNTYSRQKKGMQSGFALFLSECCRAKISLGFDAPQKVSFGSFAASGNISLSGPSLHLAAGASSGFALFGPLDVSGVVTFFSADFSLLFSCAYGYSVAVSAAIVPPALFFPDDSAFSLVASAEDVAALVEGSGLSGSVLWVKILFFKL